MLSFCILLVFQAVEYLGRLCSWFVSRLASNDKLEKEVLRFMAEDPYWHSTRSVFAKLSANAAAPRPISPKPQDLAPLPRIKARAASVCYPVRNLWHRWRIEEVMQALWRKGCLQRIHSNPKYYRIRFS